MPNVNVNAARDVVVAFRVRPSLARRIREAARRDGRTPSAFLNFFLEQSLTKLDGHARG